MDLLPLQKTAFAPEYFPAGWQAVIFRNWGKVRADRIAAVLGTTAEQVKTEAERLGLENVPYLPVWRKRGYLTIVRENWYLLSYGQLETLLEIDGETLEKWLYHEDFLFVKLGGFKPDVSAPAFAPLDEAQRKRTEEIAAIVRAQDLRAEEQPFDFEKRFSAIPAPAKWERKGNVLIEDRIVHTYLGGSGDLLETDLDACFSDAYLAAVSARGVNGLFIHAVLDQLIRFPFEPARSKGFKARQEILREICARMKKFGISLYLYLNEPRGLPLSFFQTHPELLGDVSGGLGALCTSLPQVKEYLKNAVRELFVAVPELGGIITITMSENLTNCYSHTCERDTQCPRCKNRLRAEVVSEVNSLIREGMRAAGSDAKLIAWVWSWNESRGFRPDEVEKGIGMLPEDVAVMCNSEEKLPVRVGEVDNEVFDYTVSQSARAPSPYTRSVFAMCDRKNRKKYAKIQLNTSWECCTAPFLPVFETSRKHMDNLLSCGVSGLILGWTLGGYPSPNMEYFMTRYTENGPDYEEWLEKTYGTDAEKIGRATHTLSEAFENFPFAIELIYNSPVNIGAANPFYAEKTGEKATMTCYPFDDTDAWAGPYRKADVMAAFDRTCAGIARALSEAEGATGARAAEFFDCAQAMYCNFKSTLNQMRFSETTDAAKRRALIADEEMLTCKTLALIRKNCAFGFEASNHYFWDVNILLEKLVNLDDLKRKL